MASAITSLFQPQYRDYMTQLFKQKESVILHAAKNYPKSNEDLITMNLSGPVNAEKRAMTIASFHIAQNETVLTDKPMDKYILTFLMGNSSSTVNSWKKNGWLTKQGKTYQLTISGLKKCEDSLKEQEGLFNTTEGKVDEWINRMINGYQATRQKRGFSFKK